MVTATPEKVEVTIPPDLEVPDSVKKVLTDARELISLGWTQGSLHRRIEVDGKVGDSYCMLGAIYRAAELNALPMHYHAIQSSNIVERVVGGAMTAWNDDPDRRKEHVLAVFDELIAN